MSSKSNGINARRNAELAAYYRRHLLDEVMPFWESRVSDKEYGGYLSGFDRSGNVTETEKYVWLQARLLWMFSVLYNQVEKRDLWLKLARLGRDFLVKYAYAGDGRWNYLLDRVGRVLKGPESMFSDHFALEALCEYATAAGSESDITLIRATCDSLEKLVDDPDRHSFTRFQTKTRFKAHAVYMITIRVMGVAEQVLGTERVRRLIDRCLDQVLNVFAKDERRLLFEYVGRDGNVMEDDKDGRLICPGHGLESMWFCLEEGRKRGDRSVVDRAIQVADWTYRYGHDNFNGGVLTFLDSSGEISDYPDWHKKRNLRWDEKVWWVHSEALYATALMALEAKNEEYFGWFEDLHDWCKQHFYDPEYGEWYLALRRDGTPRNTCKGGMQKTAYHLPRALLLLMKLFERYS